MSQTVSSDPKTLAQSIDAAIVRKAAMQPSDRYANHLMDEIFDEVEQVLDGSLLPPDEPVKMEFAKPDINLDIANMLAERYPLLAQKLEEANAAPIPDLPGPDIALHKVDEKVAAPAPTSAGLSLFERFMIFTGCASAVAALAVWLISQGLIAKGANFLSRQLIPASPVAMNAPIPSPVNSADVQFSDYVLRSLAALDRDAVANPQMVAIVPSTAPGAKPLQSGTMLPKPSPSNLKLGPNQTATAKPGVMLPAQGAFKPLVPVTQTDLVTRTEMNQVMNRIVGMLERVAPGVSNRLPLPAGSVAAPTKAPVRVAAAIKPTASAATPQSNEPKRRLNGVVPWGDKSLVMIEYNGASQRVYLGDSVGSTGWTLIKVEDLKATFRKNGEFRTVSDGEFF